MSNNNQETDNKIIVKKVIEFFNFRNGEFRGWEIVNYCKKFTKKNVYQDTVLRRMRDLRSKGVISYSLVGKAGDSLYRINK